MTTKQTILIAAATYFTLEFSIWALGWMIYPMAWLALGYASARYDLWLDEKRWPTLDNELNWFWVLFGPLIGIIAFLDTGKDYINFNLPIETVII